MASQVLSICWKCPDIWLQHLSIPHCSRFVPRTLTKAKCRACPSESHACRCTITFLRNLIKHESRRRTLPATIHSDCLYQLCTSLRKVIVFSVEYSEISL
ncbi:hypothetical protein J6590_067624 [Homalodisca vitripennis]|nr:hypothetical protein J6590_067624 [Homalodisca vitripennis]